MFSIAKLTAMKRWVSLLAIVVVLGGWQSLVWAECGVVTEIPQAQCEALIAIYDSTDGNRLIPPAQSRYFKHNGKRNH